VVVSPACVIVDPLDSINHNLRETTPFMAQESVSVSNCG